LRLLASLIAQDILRKKNGRSDSILPEKSFDFHDPEN